MDMAGGGVGRGGCAHPRVEHVQVQPLDSDPRRPVEASQQLTVIEAVANGAAHDARGGREHLLE
jgi:hypothetical protein